MAESPELATPTGSEGEDRRPRRRRWIPYVVLGLLIVVGGGWGLREWLYARGHETTDNAQVEGHVVASSQILMSLVDEHDVWVVANLKETQLDEAEVGQPVEIEVDAYRALTFTGHVESIQGATGARFALLPPDNATGNFTKVVQRVPVRVALERRAPSAPVLRPGMSVEVAIDTRVRQADTTASNAHALVDR
jgi:multidrug resistance efflux pump